MRVASDRRWQLAAAPEAVWSALADTAAYPAWWPWLRRFDAKALAAGEVWRCTVKPPLPYALRFDIALDELHAPEYISARLSGDLRGTARIEIAPSAAGSTLRLVSDLQPQRRPIAVISALAGPLARWGHDWVLETGVRQFADRALATPRRLSGTHSGSARRPA